MPTLHASRIDYIHIGRIQSQYQYYTLHIPQQVLFLLHSIGSTGFLVMPPTYEDSYMALYSLLGRSTTYMQSRALLLSLNRHYWLLSSTPHPPTPPPPAPPSHPPRGKFRTPGTSIYEKQRHANSKVRVYLPYWVVVEGVMISAGRIPGTVLSLFKRQQQTGRENCLATTPQSIFCNIPHVEDESMQDAHFHSQTLS